MTESMHSSESHQYLGWKWCTRKVFLWFEFLFLQADKKLTFAVEVKPLAVEVLKCYTAVEAAKQHCKNTPLREQVG